MYVAFAKGKKKRQSQLGTIKPLIGKKRTENLMFTLTRLLYIERIGQELPFQCESWDRQYEVDMYSKANEHILWSIR